jgi:hypothetical protein
MYTNTAGLRLTLLQLPQDKCHGGSCQREGGRCTVCGEPARSRKGDTTYVTPRQSCTYGCKEKIGGYCPKCGDGYHVPVGLVTKREQALHWTACIQAKPWCTEEILKDARKALRAVLVERGVDSAA